MLLEKPASDNHLYPRLVITPMIQNHTALIIPLLATGYLLGIYLLLTFAERTIKSPHYLATSWRETYTNYLPTEQARQRDSLRDWVIGSSGLASQGEQSNLIAEESPTRTVASPPARVQRQPTEASATIYQR